MIRVQVNLIVKGFDNGVQKLRWRVNFQNNNTLFSFSLAKLFFTPTYGYYLTEFTKPLFIIFTSLRIQYINDSGNRIEEISDLKNEIA